MTIEYVPLTLNSAGKLRRQRLRDRDYLVVPCSMMAEGVWEGSNGPLFYRGEDHKNAVPAWNQKPITVGHPERNGVGISAADPEVIETRQIGFLLNTSWNEKLRTECWIDELRCGEVDNRILTAVKEGKPVEVSTGLFTDNVGPGGEFNGKKYNAIAQNHRPDHLAILPDKIGAFSVKDGGGLTVNKLTLNEEKLPGVTRSVLNESIKNALAPLGVTLTENELSFSDVSNRLCELLAAKFGEPGKYWNGYIVEVFDNKVIYQQDRNSMYSIGYSNNKTSDTISLEGDPVQVTHSSEYKPVNNQKENKVADFNKKEYVTKLIGNGFVETDRGFLEGLPDADLQRIKPVPAISPPPPPAVPPVVKPVENKNISMDEYIASAPKPLQPVLRNSLATYRAEVETLVANILKSPSNKFTAERLREIGESDFDSLKSIAALIPPPASPPPPVTANYAGQSGAVRAPETVTPLPPVAAWNWAETK